MLFWFYRMLISPALSMFSGGTGCVFSISCSQFSQKCFARYSLPLALWFTLRRVARCHPTWRVARMQRNSR